MQRRKFRCRVYVSLCFTLSFLFLYKSYQFIMTEDLNPWNLNYFVEDLHIRNSTLVVNTPNCQIIDMDPFDPSILSFVSAKVPKTDCHQVYTREWTYVTDDNELILNETAVIQSGFSLSSLSCCYKSIHRVTQTLEKYDMNADKVVGISEECTRFHKNASPTEEFIRVYCYSTSWPWLYELVYRHFHAVPIIDNKPLVKEKLDLWRTKTEEILPPNVVLLGVDSMSRSHFHRSLPHTRLLLEKMGAVEMLGYTKVGENTFPNTVVFLSGLDETSIRKVCHQSNKVAQDDCPYIWGRFSDAGYVTATVEDAPALAGFNYMKTGFVLPPTDFYFRPFMLAVHKSIPRSDFYVTDCIGPYTTEETMLRYVSDILRVTRPAPTFIHSWMTSLCHQHMNNAANADETFVNFLSSTDWQNTILVFFSDHGYRYGAIRSTLPGWYEDKLPTLWIYIPPRIRSQKPEWIQNLRDNAHRLSSPYDLYFTFNDFLESFISVPPLSPETASDGHTKIQRVFGSSFLQSMNSSRSCADTGIPINYCACMPPKKLSVNDTMLVRSADIAVQYLNNAVPSVCVKLTVQNVVAGAIMESGNEKVYIVTFTTSPGDFLFEANVENVQGTFRLTTDLLRMNKITRDASCVTTSLLERYCFCK